MANIEQTKSSDKSGLKYFLAALGPGFILAATSIGPGSIVSSTNAGANFGYNLFWWFIVMLVFRAVFSLAMNRYTVVTGKPLMVGIREKYGKVWAVLAGVFAFLGQCVYGIGNFMGCGLGMNMLFPGLPVKYGGLIALVICAVLFFLKNLYHKMETVMKVLVGIMAIIFIISLIGTAGIPYDGTVSHSIVGMPAGSMALMLSLLGTTASLGTCAWGSSLAKEKGYTTRDIDQGGLRIDVIVGVIAIGVISLCCFFVGANLLPGAPIKNGMDLLSALSGLLGAWVRPVFGIGFLAARHLLLHDGSQAGHQPAAPVPGQGLRHGEQGGEHHQHPHAGLCRCGRLPVQRRARPASDPGADRRRHQHPHTGHHDHSALQPQG